MRRSLQPLLITALLASFPYVLLAVPDKRTTLFELALRLPFVMTAMIGFLSLKLNQRRPFYLALLLAGLYALVAPGAAAAGALGLSGADCSAAAAIALPATLLLLFSLPERFLSPGKGLTGLVVTLLPALLLLVALRAGGETARSVVLWRGSGLGRTVFLPAAGLLLAVAFAAATPFARDRFARDFRLFASLSLLPFFHVLHRSASGEVTPLMRLGCALGFLSGATILTYAVFRLYWHKVFVDELTGIPNRRALNDRLGRLRGSYSIAMTDIDHFKRFNDSYGHEEGDHVLRFVAKHLDSEARGQAYRYGGEEFCVVLHGVEPKAATERMDRARQRLADRQFHIRAPKKVRDRTSQKDRAKGGGRTEQVQVTVSIGVAASGPELTRPEDVLIAADAALYRAKELGRNRVLLAQVSSERATRAVR